MLKARKANRVVRIADSQQRQYETLGYKITDMEGNTISAPIDKDAIIADLKEHIEQLKTQLAQAQAEKAEEPDEKPAPKTKTARKKAE